MGFTRRAYTMAAATNAEVSVVHCFPLHRIVNRKWAKEIYIVNTRAHVLRQAKFLGLVSGDPSIRWANYAFT